MALITLLDAQLAFGHVPLLDHAGFSLETAERVGLIGLPLPGISLKLVPNGTKLEVRVKGPTVTPGYLHRPDLTKAAFDEEDFYSLGDAAKFVDESDPLKGLVFDGRVTEDFKLGATV